MANKKKKEFFLVRWFKRVFLGTDREVRSILEEEQVQTPLRTVVHNFVRKKSAMLGVVVFLCIFALVIIGPYIWKLDLSEQDSTLINLPPGYNMMSLPKETEGKVSDIAAGRTYGIGVDTDGHVYTWGHTRITDKIDIADIPEEVQEADLSLIAAGDDHAVALDENGQLYVWGNTRLRQDNFSRDMEKGMETGENWDIIQLEASNQFSAAVSSEGTLYLWGNPNMADVKIRSEYQGNIAKVALTANEYVSLLKDGTVAYTGYKGSGNPLASIPEGLTGKTVVDIASTSKTAAALTEDGEVYVWGNATSGEANRYFRPGPWRSTAAGSTTPPCWRTAAWSAGATTNTARRMCPPRSTARRLSAYIPATSRTMRWTPKATCIPGA